MSEHALLTNQSPLRLASTYSRISFSPIRSHCTDHATLWSGSISTGSIVILQCTVPLASRFHDAPALLPQLLLAPSTQTPQGVTQLKTRLLVIAKAALMLFLAPPLSLQTPIQRMLRQSHTAQRLLLTAPFSSSSRTSRNAASSLTPQPLARSLQCWKSLMMRSPGRARVLTRRRKITRSFITHTKSFLRVKAIEGCAATPFLHCNPR